MQKDPRLLPITSNYEQMFNRYNIIRLLVLYSAEIYKNENTTRHLGKITS